MNLQIFFSFKQFWMTISSLFSVSFSNDEYLKICCSGWIIFVFLINKIINIYRDIGDKLPSLTLVNKNQKSYKLLQLKVRQYIV
jgi:hypothetical protein